MRTTKPHVKRWKWGSDTTKWVIDGLRDERGKRIRRFFPSRDEANEWLAQRRPELNNQGRAALGMTDRQRVDAVRALKVLEPFGASLTAAAEAYAVRARILERTVAFKVLREEAIRAKAADGSSDRYLADLRSRLARFGADFDDRPVAGIETRELDDWLRNLDLSPVSRVNFRKVLRTTFEFAVSRGYSPTNPVVKTAEVKADVAAPGILAPTEIAVLLASANPKIIPAIALAAFAGLRDAEIGRLTWDRIDLVGGHIKIDAAIAKTSSRRIVPIATNLNGWLAPHAVRKGDVRPSPSISYPLYRAARKAAVEAVAEAGGVAPNLESWPHNALRHSYASYRMALLGNAAQVAEECGHSVQIMKQHYRELVTKKEAEAWFAVVPATDGAGLVRFG